MKPVLNLGVIGVGTIGKAHLQACSNLKNVKVAAISDINEAELESTAKKFKIRKCLTDYSDLLALKEVEAVIICTPPFNHAQITCDAAAAEKHVLCEKPMAMNSSEARKMVDACKEVGVKLGIASARSRFDPAVEMARQYISEGKLGKVYYARVSVFRRRGRPGIDILVDSKWFIDSSKAGGGSLIDIGCYDIDVMLYLLGSPQPCTVSAMTYRGIEDLPKLETKFDVEEHASLFVRFANDTNITFETSWATNLESGENVIILGSKGGLRLHPFTYYTKQDGEHIALTIDLARRRSWTNQMEMLIDDFALACLEDRVPKTPGEDGLKVMQVISAAYESANLGREVEIRST